MAAYLVAIVSSILFNTSIMLQARDAATAPDDVQMSGALLLFLVKRWMWLAGTACMTLSVVLQTVAMTQVSVDVMQSITAAGVLLLPVYGRVLLGQRMSVGELGAIVAIVASVTSASLLVGAQEGDARTGSLALAIGCAACSLVPFFVAKAMNSGPAMMVVAGIGFSGFTILQKQLALTHDWLAVAAICAGFAGCAYAGFIAEMSALQTVSPMRVAPAVLGLMTAIPVLVAPLLFTEHWPNPAGTLASLAVLVAASGYIASRAHGGVLAHEPMPEAAAA